MCSKTNYRESIRQVFVHYEGGRRRSGSLRTMPAKMITYRIFFEGLISEFVNNYRNRFFPGGLFLNLVIITDRFFPQGSHFRVR